MKRKLHRSILQLLPMIICLFASYYSHGEGTRELSPTLGDDNRGVLQIWDNQDLGRNSFTYAAPANRRLYFNVCLPGEQVYWGVNFDPGDLTAPATLWYRIKFDDGSPNGQIVVAPTQVTNAGAGSIANWNQAVAGPSNMPGGSAAGYVARTFDPMTVGTGPGIYWIEFNRNNPNNYDGVISPANNSTVGTVRKTRLRFFDLTIYDDASVSGPLFGLAAGVRLGRLYSQAWDINCNSGTNRFNAAMYVYSNDGIVTYLNFNGIQPHGFVISCNSTGVANTGNTFTDRQSVGVNSTYADYKIFLNNPDENCYPTGIFGDITAPVTISGCDVNNRCINITVDKGGKAEVILNFNGIPGYQPSTSDRLLTANLIVGTNCVPWDSRDGLGNLVPNGSNIDMRLDYFNGLTHLPLFDVENHERGYIVQLVRPAAGTTPLLFWDDRLVGQNGNPPGAGGANTGIQLGGYTTSMPTNGGHRWSNAGGQGVDWGDKKTVNTWWYANYINRSVSYSVPGSIAVDADATTPGTGAANNKSICNNQAVVNLSGSFSGSTGINWTTTGTGVFSAPTATTGTYTPSAGDKTAGSVKLFVTSTGNGSCPAVKDSIILTFTPGPTVNAGPDRLLCANNATANLNGSFTVATGILWTGGSNPVGFIPNNTSAIATYTPTAAEIASGSVTLTLTTTGNGLCPASSDQMTITYTPAPTVNAGIDTSVCANNAIINLKGTATNATGTTWSGGTGTFGNAANVQTSYTPSAAELAAAPTNITLTLTAVKNLCTPVTDQVIVTITPRPTVNAGIDRTICKNDSVTLNGIVTVATGGIWSGGTGTFTPNNTTLTANYKPSAAELAGSSITLTLTTSGNGKCLPVQDNMTINFTAAPTLSNIPDKTICENNPNASLSATVTNATGVRWTGSGGTFTPNANASSVQYTPNATEISAGVTAVVVNTTGGSCPPVYDTVLIFINPAPIVDAGTPLSVCKNNGVVTLSGTVSGTPTFVWSSPSGGLFSNPNILNPTYTGSNNDINNGSVTLTLTATAAGCNPVTDQVTITYTPNPTIDAGPVRNVCANNVRASLVGTISGATGVIWSTSGDGTFDNNTSLTPFYTPGPNDIANGTVTITITSTGNGTCIPVTDNTTVNVTPGPTANAGNDFSVCANNATFTVTGSVTNAGGGNWTGGTTSSFSPSRNPATITYTPTAAEISSGSITLNYVTTGVGNCLPVSDPITITFTPPPTITHATPITVCASNPTVTLNPTITVATGVSWSGGSGTFTPNRNTINPTYTLTATEISTGTVTLTATTTGNGTCSAVTTNVRINVTPAVTINAGNDQVVCGTLSTVVNLTATATVATGGTWTIISGTGSFANANSLNTTYTPSNQDLINGSVILRVTSTGNGTCLSVSDNITITFTPESSIDAGPNRVVCTTELPIQLNATGSAAVWQPAGGTFSNVNSLNPTYTPSAAEIAAGSVTLTIRTTPGVGCPAVTDQVTITIPPGPIVNVGGNPQTMCGSNSGYTLAGSVTNATGGFWQTSGSGSFIANANDLTGQYVPSTADRTVGNVFIILTSTGNGVCPAARDTFTLIITPAIVVNAGNDQTVCGDVTSIPINGSVATATGGTWTIISGSGSFSNANATNTNYLPSAADKTAGSVTLRLTSTGNGLCPAISDDITITITPGPTINAGSDITICADSAYVQLGATLTGTANIAWTTSGTGNFVLDNVSTNSRYIPSVVDKSTGTITLTATSTGNGTCQPINDQLILTITPAPTINAGPDVNVCQNNSIVNLNATTTVASGVQWTSNGTGTFANANAASTTYTPSVADIAGGIVTLTAQTTGIGSCKVKTDQVIVNIAPSPIVSAGFNQTVCADATAININGTVTNASGGTWTTSGSGSFGNANALSTTYTPSSADTTAGSVILTLTSTGNGTCNAVTSNVTINFTKVPIVVAGPNQTICADSFYVQLNGQITNASGGIWTSSGTGTFFPNTITLNATYVPSSVDKTNGTVTLTLTTTSSGVCSAKSSSLTVTITPAPIITVSPDVTVCANNPIANFSGTFTVASGIRWSTSGTGTFSPNNTSTNISYTPSAIDIAAGSVIISMSTTGSGSCKTSTQFRTLTITPAPILNAGADKTICGDSISIQLDQVTLQNASGVSWSILNGTGPLSTPTLIQPTYYPTAADIAAGFVRFAVVSTGNGLCLPVRDTIRVNITPIPTISLGSDITVCASTSGVALTTTFSNAGGISWSTTGTGTFSPTNTSSTPSYLPSNADTTAKQVKITVTTTNNGLCKPVSDSLNILLNPVPIISAGQDNFVCADVDNLVLQGSIANATGIIWTTNGTGSLSPSNTVTKPSYTPSAADITNGSVIFTATSTGNGACSPVTSNTTVTFSPIPSISAGGNLSVCNSVATVNINASSTGTANVSWVILQGAGTLTSDNTLNTTYNVNPADIATGVILQINGTGQSGCGNVDDQITISFVAAPPIFAGNDQTKCTTDFPILLEGSGSSAQWSGGTGTFSPNDQTLNAEYTPSAAEVTAGTVTLTLTTTNNGLCPANVDQVTYTLIPGPAVAISPIAPICTNSPVVNINGTFTSNGNATGTIWTSNGSGVFADANQISTTYTPSASDKTAGKVILTLTTTGTNVNCTNVNDTLSFIIEPEPTIFAGNDITVCKDISTLALNATNVTNATGVQWSNVTSSGSFTNATSASTNYNVVTADTTAGSITIQVSTTGHNTNCPAATDDLTITFTNIPTLEAGTDIVVCSDTTTVNIIGTVGLATGGIWSTSGTGSFSPTAAALNTNYIPSSADTLAGSVTLTLTTTGNGTCNAYTDTRTITFNDMPLLNVTTPNDTVCSGNPIFSVNGNFSNATGILWQTTGTGTFDNPNAITANYTPSQADIDNGGVIVYALTTGANPCKDIAKYLSINILQSPNATVNAGFDQTVCADAAFIFLNGTVDGLTNSGIWTPSSGLGSFFPDVTDLNPIFVPDPADVTAGTLTLTLTSTNNGICPPDTDDMILTITPAPTVNAGGNLTLCSDTTFIPLSPTITVATGGVWSTTGTGYFTPSASDINAVYVPSAADVAFGTVGLTLTTTGNGTCNAYADFKKIDFTPIPTIDLGPNQNICADGIINLIANVTVATNVDWTTSGSGIFASPNPTLTNNYIFSNADTTSKVIKIQGTSVNQGLCKPVTDTITVTIQPLPLIFVSSDFNICADTNSIPVSANVANANNIIWGTNGSGNFNPNITTNNVNYLLSSNDKTLSNLKVFATSTNNGVCSAVSDTINIQIAPIPIVSAGAPIICDTLIGASLTGSVINAAGGVWNSVSNNGTFSVNNATLNANYRPTHAEIVAQSVQLVLTSTGNGLCKAVSDTTTMLIIPSPLVDAGPDVISCVGNSVSLKANPIQTGIVYEWLNTSNTILQSGSNYNVPVGGATSIILRGTDSRGCFNVDTVSIDVFTIPNFVITPNPICFTNNLIIRSNPNPVPTVPGTYQWYRNGQIMGGENKDLLSPPAVDNYSIVFDYNGCSNNANAVVNPVPVISTKDVIACNTATLTASSDITNVNWSWAAPIGGSTQTVTTPVIPNDTTKYYMTATVTTTGCSTTDSVYVIGINNPQMVQLDTMSCQGLQVRLTARPTNIPDLDRYLQVTFGWVKDGVLPGFSIDSVVTVNSKGQYIGTVTIDQCIGTSTNNVDFAPNPVSTLPDGTRFCIDDNETSTLDPGNIGGNLSYLWSTGETTQTITVQPPTDQYYNVVLTNQFLCTTRDSVLVRMICKPKISVPSGFYPGTSGPDDIFRAFGNKNNLSSYEMLVFNRWGEIIFISNDLLIGWDGMYKNELMPMGVYPYVIKYEGREEFKGPYKLTGSITLIR